MKVSYKWLSEYVDGKLSSPQKLAEILIMHSFEVESIEKIGGDFVLDVKVLPNRAHDCLSHIGIAREATAIIKSRIKNQELRIKENKKYKIADYIEIENKESKLCARYTSRVMLGVKVGPSPKWLKERLEVLGQRSINNIVDATNYAMLAMGQPIHAFDFEKVKSVNPKSKTAKIIIRKAKKDEKIITLDNQEIKLDENILVIADEAEPLAMAGIKGGKKAEVDANTKNIILESACFDSASVRRTSKKINLRTDASARFENGISPALAFIGLDYAASLIQQLAGGEIAKGAIDTNPKAYSPAAVFFNPVSINKLIGANILEKEMLDILKRLGFSVKKAVKKNGYLAGVPPERLDIETEADIAEEIVRIYGLEKVSASLPEESLALPKVNDEYVFAGKIRNILVGCGFSEAYNRTFISERQAQDWGMNNQELATREQRERSCHRMMATVANPISEEQKHLRPKLILNLLSNIYENMKHRKEARLFELGNIFVFGENGKISEHTNIGGVISSKKESGKNGANIFYELKGAADMLFEQLGIDDVLYKPDISSEHFWHSGRKAEIKIGEKQVGILGEISPALLEKIGIKERTAAFELDFSVLLEFAQEKIVYKPISKFPAVERDIAIVVPSEIAVDGAQAVIENAGGELLSDIELFDIYEGNPRTQRAEQSPYDGKNLEAERKSLAFHLVFQSPERTLTDNEINGIIDGIINAIKGKGWEIRK